MQMPDRSPSYFSHGSRVITLSAIPPDVECPIDAPADALIEVVQVSMPVHMESHGRAIHAIFIYETESHIEEHQALISANWYESQFPLRLLASIPNSPCGIDATDALTEGPVAGFEDDDGPSDSDQEG